MSYLDEKTKEIVDNLYGILDGMNSLHVHSKTTCGECGYTGVKLDIDPDDLSKIIQSTIDHITELENIVYMREENIIKNEDE